MQMVANPKGDDVHCALQLRRLFRAGVKDVVEVEEAVRRAFFTARAEATEKNNPSDVELAVQRQIHDALFADPVTAAYPPPTTTRWRVLKAVLAVLDSGDLAELDDILYEECVEGIATTAHAKGVGLVDGFDGHCTIDALRGGCVVLRVSAQMGGALETGAQLWAAGCVLLGLISSGALDGVLRGHVLELGAGTGVVGLGLARSGAAVERVTLTDGQPAVVDNLRYNAGATAALGKFTVPVEVRELEWGDARPGELPAVDAVVGSDVAYDQGCFPALAAVLRSLLRPRGAAVVAVLGVTRRIEDTYQLLLDALATEALLWEEMVFSDAAWEDAQGWARLAHDARARTEEQPTVGVLRIQAAEATMPG